MSKQVWTESLASAKVKAEEDTSAMFVAYKQPPSNGPASGMPPRMAVSRITQEQLSKPFALTHMDVRNVENVWNIFSTNPASNYVW